MKKYILLSTIIMFTFTVFAQTFQILDASKNNVSNSPITVTGDINTIIKAQLYVVNNSAGTASFKVKKIENNIQPTTSNSFCFNDQCYPPTSYESTSALTLQAGDTTTSSGFYGEYTPNDAEGPTQVTYVVFNSTNPNDSTYVVVTYVAQATAIAKINFSSIEFSNPYPNPVNVNTKINYNIPFSYVRATLYIRNIIGTIVREHEISNPQGKLNLDLSDLNEGIYFYSLVIDGNVVLTRKLIKN